jgi:predicted acyl esterase
MPLLSLPGARPTGLTSGYNGNVSRPFHLHRDVAVQMRDGATLAVNVYLPKMEAPAPVIMSVTPYGKDVHPDRRSTFFMRLAGVRFGRLACSAWTGFESPDPVYWTNAGYAVVQADVRGMHRSSGNAGVLTETDALDYAELIEWAAQQPWSSGAVGLVGVSYLAMSQWRVAALRPPSLKAIVPWEGATDLLREFAYQDGIPETGFVGTWWKVRMAGGRNRRFALAENFPRDRDQHPLDDAYWAAKRPELERIDVPALVCASWSDHGLHTRGSFEGFERIGSSRKWLYTHGRRKWETFYSDDAKALQRRFLDHVLKGVDNGWAAEPVVRLETRVRRDAYTVRSLAGWPPAEIAYRPLYLDARSHTMGTEPFGSTSVARYRARGRFAGRTSFSLVFSEPAELTGGMTLKLWVSTTRGNDLDLFVVLRKFDAQGREVPFYGFNGFARDAVAKGWLRASHRELDPSRTRPGRPWHTHANVQPVRRGEIVPVDIEVLPSSTAFEAGSTLRIDVSGRDPERYPAFRHRRTVNRGVHCIHTGGTYDSHLLAPFRPAR